MDIEEEEEEFDTNKKANQSPVKNQVNYFKHSIKSRMSNESMFSIPDAYEPKPYNEKISLESNMSQKIRREENQKPLFDELLGKEQNYFQLSRGYGSNPYQSFNRLSDPDKMIDESMQRPSEKISLEPEQKVEPKLKVTCKCSKSKCIQMYCDCFSRDMICNSDCSCYQCRNNDHFPQKREKARMQILERDPNAFKNKLEIIGGEKLELAHKKGCKCSSSHCFKKYCECFRAGVKCTYLCTCSNCLNGGQNAYQQSN